MKSLNYKRHALSTVVTGAIMLSAVAVLGTFVVSWANTNLFSHQQKLQDTYSTNVNKLNEKLIIENVWRSTPNTIDIFMNNVGSIGLNVTQVTIYKNSQQICKWQITDGGLKLGQSYSLNKPYTSPDNPVISYHDTTNGDLKVANNDSCSSGNTITTIDSTGNVGQYTSIAIGADSYPVISYHDITNLDLKVAKCGNASCSSVNPPTTVDSTGNVGQYASIAIGTDGFPVISYYDTTNGDLKVAKCGDASCSSGNTITTIDSTGNVGQYTSIAIADPNPIDVVITTSRDNIFRTQVSP